MPRKRTPKIELAECRVDVLKDIYKGAFDTKTVSVNSMRSLSKEIDYTNKEDVLKLLPLVQKQMEIIQDANDTMLVVEERINGKG